MVANAVRLVAWDDSLVLERVQDRAGAALHLIFVPRQKEQANLDLVVEPTGVNEYLKVGLAE